MTGLDTATRAIRVLIVDDQALVRAGLVALVRTDADLAVVGEAADGHEAIAQAEATAPDVILMDIRMPNLDGVAATRHILAHADDPAPKILILTTFDLDEHVFAALRAGASGFMLKDTPADQMLAAIATVARGDVLLAPSVTRRLVHHFATTPEPTRRRPAELAQLTSQETAVLRLVGQGLTNQQIATHLNIAQATVKSHLGRLMTKLRLSSRAQAVVTAYETGLITPGISHLSRG
ncbi:response regulator [Nonomuraea sediminis]|uniref:response regulator n=1 Tax=Nonomuraea sediminis TaxID=2835864 RepID=UPI001BDCFFFA|nr:response regulator transcription factor [Nonomuraea sediminis]